MDAKRNNRLLSGRRETGLEGSNPVCFTFQYLVVLRESREICVCSRDSRSRRDPGERPRRRQYAESSETYPGAIWLGPWIIAVNSPADRTRRTGPLRPTAIRDVAEDS